jgi:uncharacterized protein
MNLFLILFTGLTSGALSCLAVQGGLLASVIANQKEQERQGSKQNLKLQSFDQLDWLPVLTFLSAKLVTHVALGALLGMLGSVMSLSIEVRLIFQAFTALFMFGTAMNLLQVHPVFRYIAFQPPRFIQRLVRNTSKSRALFAPAMLGVMTIFVPCGVTQAMEVLAINSGSALNGALIMFAFVLGTSPLFALLGVATAKFSEGWHKLFSKIAAYALVVMALYSLNGVLVVMNFPITVGKLTQPITYFFSEERFASDSGSPIIDGRQRVTIAITDSGYNPRYIQVKSGTPVELTLESKDAYSCALAFVFKEFGIKTFLEATDRQVFNFTPNKPGKYTFSCSMGMYTGVMEVK